MSATDYGHLVMVLLGCALVAGLVGWSRAARQIWSPFSLVLLLAALATAGAAPSITLTDGPTTALAVFLGGALAVVGGGPVTTLLFTVVDRQHPDRVDSIEHAGEALRGGLWIGLLERAAIFAALVSGWPEGVAFTLALKGLGRYPELRTPGAAERFIIGTFASVLWAAACAGAVLLAR